MFDNYYYILGEINKFLVQLGRKGVGVCSELYTHDFGRVVNVELYVITFR